MNGERKAGLPAVKKMCQRGNGTHEIATELEKQWRPADMIPPSASDIGSMLSARSL